MRMVEGAYLGTAGQHLLSSVGLASDFFFFFFSNAHVNGKPTSLMGMSLMASQCPIMKGEVGAKSVLDPWAALLISQWAWIPELTNGLLCT